MSTFLGIIGVVLYVTGLVAAYGVLRLWRLFEPQVRKDEAKHATYNVLVPYVVMYGLLAFLAGTVALRKSGWTILPI